MADSPEPWERQPGEGPKAYAAFVVYRDQGPKRGLRPTARQVGKSVRQLTKWSTRWRWVERARAWDEELDRAAREAQVTAVKEMRDRHAREAMELQRKAIEALKRLKPEDLSANDVLRYFVEAAKLERIARGEPETIQEQRHEGNWMDAVVEAHRRRRESEEGRDAGTG